MHEVNLWVELEHLSGLLVSLELFRLFLPLLVKLLALFLSELCGKLLISLLAHNSLPRVLFLHQLILNIRLAFQALFMPSDSFLALRGDLTLISLCKRVLSFYQVLNVLVLALSFLNLAHLLNFVKICLSDSFGGVWTLGEQVNFKKACNTEIRYHFFFFLN